MILRCDDVGIIANSTNTLCLSSHSPKQPIKHTTADSTETGCLQATWKCLQSFGNRLASALFWISDADCIALFCLALILSIDSFPRANWPSSRKL